MARGYTEEELAALDPIEREALLDDETGEIPGPSNVDGDVFDDPEALNFDEESDDEANADDTAADAKKKDDDQAGGDDAGAGADADAAAADGGDDTDQPADKSPAPILEAEAPADAEARLTELKTKKEELAEQFDNGDLTGKEYQSQLDNLNREERAIEQDIFKAKLAGEMSQTQARNAWKETVDGFLGEHAEYKTSTLRYQALDSVVKEIAADEANASLTGRQILEKAHERVTAELGGIVAPKKDDGKADEGKGKGANDKEIPMNLSKVPAAEINGEGNRFASLDRLAETDPLAYEAQLAKLSPADRDAYLAQ